MKISKAWIVAFLASTVCVCSVALPARLAAQAQGTGQAAIAKRIGTIKTISGNAITLAPDSGPEVAVTLAPNARLLRLAPGEKDLKNTTPIQLQDLQTGDTIRVRGYASDDAKSLTALEVIVITKTALNAVGDQIRQDWQKRGIAGLVDSVDPAVGNISLSIPGLMGKKTVVIHTNKSTVIYRYSPESARPEDAKVCALRDVQAGDQLRARGTRSADGSELTAEEIYTGIFLQFDATIKSIDASAGTLSVQDLKSKKTLQLKVIADSQLHQIPEEMAQHFAAMLKMATGGGFPRAGGAPSGGAPGAGTGNSSAPAAGADLRGANGGGGRFGAGGGGDLQRRLDQTPAVKLADLHKGGAISVLATEGTPAAGSTVIKLFSGVEPILQAAPNASQAMMLAPWNLGGAPGGDSGNQ